MLLVVTYTDCSKHDCNFVICVVEGATGTGKYISTESGTEKEQNSVMVEKVVVIPKSHGIDFITKYRGNYRDRYRGNFIERPLENFG